MIKFVTLISTTMWNNLHSSKQARIQAAQYAHLPLSTIGSDWIIDAADALFARQLREWPALASVSGAGISGVCGCRRTTRAPCSRQPEACVPHTPARRP